MIETISAIIKGAGVCCTVYELFNDNDRYSKIQRTLDKLVDSHLVAGIILLNKMTQSEIVDNEINFVMEAHKEFILAQAMYKQEDKKYLTSLEFSALCEIIIREPHMAIRTLDTIGIYYYKQLKLCMLVSPEAFAFPYSFFEIQPVKDLCNVLSCQKDIAKYYNIDINESTLESQNCLMRITQMLKLK